MQTDIVVIGAGPAGLSFARNVADTGLNITLIEKQSERSLSDPQYDGREIALTHHSKEIMKKLGMWSLLSADELSVIKDAKVLNGTSPFALSFDHHEARVDNLGFMISNNVIRRSAYASLEGYRNVSIIDNSEVTDISTNTDNGWIELSDGRRLEARLIVSADSRFSATRRMMGIATDMLDFGRTCIVCTMSVDRTHDDTAYECFHDDQTLAVLPLNGNQVSVVVTVKTERSGDMINISAEEFEKDIERRFDHRLGGMKLTSELFSYPLVATFAKYFHSDRFALVGDAAVGMHPVTAHGFNLGLRGSDILAREIKRALKAGRDYSAQRVLERYSREHRRICMPLYQGTNALVQLYTKQSPPAKLARHVLLRIAKRLPPARRLIMNQLTEHGPSGTRPRILPSPRRFLRGNHG